MGSKELSALSRSCGRAPLALTHVAAVRAPPRSLPAPLDSEGCWVPALRVPLLEPAQPGGWGVPGRAPGWDVGVREGFLEEGMTTG